MKLAKSNTDKNLETCGVLAGLLVSAVHSGLYLSNRQRLIQKELRNLEIFCALTISETNNNQSIIPLLESLQPKINLKETRFLMFTVLCYCDSTNLLTFSISLCVFVSSCQLCCICMYQFLNSPPFSTGFLSFSFSYFQFQYFISAVRY